MLEEKLSGPMRDMVALERELLNTSKKDESFRSEEMKVEMFRMSLVEKFCEYMDSYGDYFKRGALMLSNYQEEVSKTKSASRRHVEDILKFTLESDAEAAAENEAMRSSNASLGNSGGSHSQHDGHPNPADVLPIFGTSLEDTTQRDGTSIPRIVLHIVAFLDQMALSQMGIFRISGHNGSVQALREAIDSGHEVDLSLLNNAHVAATLFKLYLRRLPETLTIRSRFDEWIGALGPGTLNSSTDGTTPRWPDSVIETFAGLVESLPSVYAHSLDYLIAFCTRVVAHADQNMMGAKNLASLIAPNILNRPDTAVLGSTEAMLFDVAQANKAIECLILNYDRIFANIQYDFKPTPDTSLEALAAEYPLCADRNVRHGMSMIVDLPPDENGTDSTPKSDDRKVKKKTMSSISLLKDRKIKKKDKNVAEVRATVNVGEADFKVFPSNSASLRPVSPRGIHSDRPNYSTVSPSGFYSDHQRTFSDIPTSSGSPLTSPRTLPTSSSLKERDSPMSSPRSQRSSPPGSSDELPPRGAVHSVPTLSIPSRHQSSTPATSSGLSSSPPEKSPPISPRLSPREGKDKRHSKHTSSKDTDSDATSKKGKKKNRKSVAHRSSVNQSSQPTDPVEATKPAVVEITPAPVATPNTGRHTRRHSIGLASEEGLDPTKENFGSLDATAAADIVIQSGTPSLSINNSLSVEALVDDNNGTLSRRRANSRRSSSVLGNPFTASPARSPSVTSVKPMPSPIKRKPSATQSDLEASSSAPGGGPAPHISRLEEVEEPGSQGDLKTPASKDQNKGKRLSSQPLTLHIPSNLSNDGAPNSPTSKDTPSKKNKDRTMALSSVKFENSEDFNKVMDNNFGKGPVASYVVLGYNSNNALYMQSGGEGGVTELVSQLQDDQIQYGLIRISYKEDGHALTRDVFVQWNGPKVSAIQKGIRKGHCGEVKNALCPTAIEILASTKTNFTLETLLARSAPTASRIID